MYRYLKLIDDDNYVALFMNENSRNILYIENMEGTDKLVRRKVNLLDYCNEENKEKTNFFRSHGGSMKFDHKFTMATDKFHAICKILGRKNVEINANGNEIMFNDSSNKISIAYENQVSKTELPENTIFFPKVQIMCELPHLLLLSKYKCMCNELDIFIKNNCLLCIAINVTTLGKLYFFIESINKEI